jgi:hypothetical protein
MKGNIIPFPTAVVAPSCFGKISVFFGSSNIILKLSNAFIRSLAGTLSFKNKYKCNPPLLEKHGTNG